MRVIRIPIYPDHSDNPLKRAANYLSFALSATILGPLLTNRVEVMHVFHPPITIGLPAWVISRVKGIPFTLEIQDMWPETLFSTGMLRNKSALWMIDAYAKWVYSRAALIRVISPGFRTNLLKKQVPDKKIRMISNWVDTNYYKPTCVNKETLARYGMQGRFNILYAGTIGLAQGLDVIMDAADRIKKCLPDVQFVLAGEGVECGRLREEAANRNLNNVRFLGQLPGDAMPSLYACADVLMLHLRSDPLFAITIPHKVFTYLAAGKPVLVGGEGDVASLVTGGRAGIVCRPSDPEALAHSIEMFHAMSSDERNKMGNNGRVLACQSYSRPRLMGEINEMIKEAVV